MEINGSTNPNIFEKNSEYAFSIIVESTKSNKKYSKIILINIDNFNKFNTKEPLLHFKLKDEQGHIENESYNSIHLILENAVNREYNKNVDERIVNFSKFLKTNNLEDMKKIFKGSEEYMAAIRRVEDLSTDPNFIGYYDVEEARKAEMEEVKEYAMTHGLEEGKRIGIEEGLQQGISESRIEIAKNMFKHNEPIEKISQYTNISIDELKKLNY